MNVIQERLSEDLFPYLNNTESPPLSVMAEGPVFANLCKSIF